MLELAPTLTIVCFLWWAFVTITIILRIMLGRVDVKRKSVPWYDLEFIFMRSGIAAWFSMWAFRTMFSGPLF
jgi:hypothetical protein